MRKFSFVKKKNVCSSLNEFCCKFLSYLCSEVGSSFGWVVLGVTSDITTTQFFDGDVLDVETNVVTGNGLNEGFVVHLDGLDFSGQTSWSESHDGTGLNDTGLDTANGYRSDTTNLVNVLKNSFNFVN